MNMSYVSSRPLFVKRNGQQIEAGRRLVTWRRPEILPGYIHTCNSSHTGNMKDSGKSLVVCGYLDDD